MIKRLRTKFVLIIMVLVGAVLAGVLGGTLISTWQSQRDITIEALERGIEGNMFDRPRWGINELVEREEGGLTLGKPPEHGKTNLFVLTVDLDADGIVLATNDAPVVLDGAVMQQVLDEALSSDEDMGWDTSIHIAWMRAERAFGTWRVVICDTSAQDLTMRTLIVRNLVIITIAMLLLLAIAIGLSTWVLRPVEEAWEQQRRFVADASHELKTPLAVISANTQILMADDGIPRESRRWVESTRDEATHMKGLVEELLELARTDETQAGGSVMHNERVDMSSLVESSALEFDAIAYERGTSIEEDVEEGIFCEGDPEWLERLTRILIDNACKYAQGSEPVSVRLHRDGRKCVLSVNNHGTPIDAADLPHVFDRFYRSDEARERTESGGGFGLGLAIAQGIAHAHKGEISCTSDETSGTTFTVALPCAS